MWWFGHGVGRTTTTIGTIVVFPPWGLYLLANAGIVLAGYEPMYITDALPEETRTNVLSVYDGVTSVPGRVNAAITGRKFYNSPSLKPKTNKDVETKDRDEKNRNRSKIDTPTSQRTR
jgi:hypothetical protein